MYVCAACGKEVKEIGEIVRCPFCGYRILYKARQPIGKRVKAR